MFESLTSRFEIHLRVCLWAAFIVYSCFLPMGCATPAAPSGRSYEPARLVIHNVTVRSMTGSQAKAPQSVFIQGQRIIRIVDAQAASLLPSDRVIDAKGHFLIPGLADMHSHAETPQEMARYLAHGVTLLRIMSGYEAHLLARDAIAAGNRIGPTLVVASPIIDGDPPARSELASVADAAAAKQQVRTYQGMGFDQIKLYHNLSREAFIAAVSEAHAFGMKAVGHVPIALGATSAFEAGYDSSEHFAGVLQAIQSAPPAFGEHPSSTEWSLRSAVGADVDSVPAIASLAREHDVWLVPTLAMHRVLQAPPEQWAIWADDPRVGQVSPGARNIWQRELEGRQGLAPELYELAAQAWQTLLRVTLAVHQTGAELLVGTDYGMPYLFAGEAVHQEIRILVEAGLDNEAALHAATVKPAEFLDQRGEFGTVEPGARADLVLLREDPFEDIAALEAIEGVVVRGHWFDRTAIDTMLETGSIPGQVRPEPLPVCTRKASGNVAMIEDFDDGDQLITGDNRSGMWFDFDDGSAGQQTPTQQAWSLSPGGLNETGNMLHVRGGGFTVWGSGIGVSFAWDVEGNRACAYDARSWDGIGFWAKGNVSGLAMALPELDVVAIEQGGRCEQSCNGSHQALVDLGECWQHYAFTFEELAPPSWSPEQGPVDPAELTGVQFIAYRNTAEHNQFEYWIDEVEFFRGRKPQGERICEGGAGAGP